MVIEKDRVVSIDYTLKNDKGVVIDSSEGSEPLVYLHGNENIIPGLEKELEGKKMGDSLSCVIAPADAYGERDDSLIFQVPRDKFKDFGELEIGMQFHTGEEGGIIQITEIADQTVTVDANHPLAGERLHFDVKVVEVREASAEELEHGHVHGDCDCDCDCEDDEGGCDGGCHCGH